MDLGKIIGASGEVIGRYDRGDITPSVEVVSIIADALEISVDYLLGKTKMELDKQALKCLEEIPKLSQDNKNFVINLIDMALRDFKAKKLTRRNITTPRRSGRCYITVTKLIGHLSVIFSVNKFTIVYSYAYRRYGYHG